MKILPIYSRTEHESMVCPTCGEELDETDGINNDEAPDPGSVTVCCYCGALLIFNDQLKLRPATDEDLAHIKRIDPETYQQITMLSSLFRPHTKPTTKDDTQ